MNIDLIAVGKRMPDWIESAANEYQKRLPQQIQLKLVEITPANRTRKNSASNYKSQEEERILSAVKPDHIIVLLDETGKAVNSKQLATTFKTWIDNQQSASIIIGGADGVSDNVKQKAAQTWSLSALTLPHAIVRILILEQIYRAWTIINNHPYHRE